jgi:DNA-binding transcriptional LysR family regulator
LLRQGIERRFAVQVPGFAGLPSFMRGTPLLTTVPGLLQHHLMRGLANAKVPVPCPEMPMYMIWHLRHQQDPAHQWLRQQLQAVAQPLVGAHH